MTYRIGAHSTSNGLTIDQRHTCIYVSTDAYININMCAFVCVCVRLCLYVCVSVSGVNRL